MTKSVFTVAFLLISVAALLPGTANAQNPVLAEMYGRGVHAYYSGDNTAAQQFLTMAIDNGTQDPRAYYFRGLVAHASGRGYEAEADWRQGAEMEANGRANATIGRSLARFQGSARLKLESIRQTARLQALATAASRSKARYGEIEQAESRVLRQPPPPGGAMGAAPSGAGPAITPPVTPPPAGESPFGDDMATGDATLQSNDALEGAMDNPFTDDAAVPAGAVPANDAGNPFDAPGGAADSSPFGGSDDADSSPFGDDTGDAMEDSPFGGNPFD